MALFATDVWLAKSSKNNEGNELPMDDTPFVLGTGTKPPGPWYTKKYFRIQENFSFLAEHNVIRDFKNIIPLVTWSKIWSRFSWRFPFSPFSTTVLKPYLYSRFTEAKL